MKKYRNNEFVYKILIQSGLGFTLLIAKTNPRWAAMLLSLSRLCSTSNCTLTFTVVCYFQLVQWLGF